MTKKRISLLIFFLSAGLAFGYLYLKAIAKLRAAETCSAMVVVFNKDAQANLTLDFMYNRRTLSGIVSVSGRYRHPNHPEGTIRRDVAYTWVENKNTFQLLSTNINKVDNVESLPDDVIATIMPAFYVYPNRQINYAIKRQGGSSFLFSVGKRPLFVCST
ncbi:hypothetical protein HF650_08830 [Kosakonia sp. SMBL-WEM22]|uniref:hypothetical protein n=1 Tax=Kosakonia sp. SMBL-WEM22 TaxID=2725560 RepID=UPI001658E5DD|nr:hypothetical protein [Kosakonia sp. SMBL-WEM22]MDV5356009.1 hypothetical protein [Enterobacter asburiae]QNQ19858.1 hypothetical protein HF650_08830 [Kosakonia sp. SMBL-WEM22]